MNSASKDISILFSHMSSSAINNTVAFLAKETIAESAVNESTLAESAEKDLYQTLKTLSAEVQPLLNNRNYTEALSKLAALRTPIDAFFDNVMVMADDPVQKANRLTLLAQLRGLFLSVADISILQS